ncbi:MAG: hypothetical protein V7K25_30905 [Nostoc sp.]|uniref:hypothetical protein n=1 Tax=Nostoc sp. TaxID=1180 RepID=UPI002FF64BFB
MGLNTRTVGIKTVLHWLQYFRDGVPIFYRELDCQLRWLATVAIAASQQAIALWLKLCQSIAILKALEGAAQVGGSSNLS